MVTQNKKTVTLIFTVFVALSLAISGCASSKKNNTEQSSAPAASQAAATQQPAASQAAAQEAPIEISWLSEDPPNEDENQVQKYLEDKFNVKITNVKLDVSTFADQVNLLAASNKLPDMMYGRYDYASLAKQGLLMELPVDLIKQHMPKYSATVDQVDPNLWNLYTVNGKNYGIPHFTPGGALPYIPLYRQDWLTKIGYSKPPETLQELEDVLIKFHTMDPDGNGKTDTYGMTARGKDAMWYSFNLVMGAFQVQPYQWKKDASGKIVYGMTTEDAKKGYVELRKLYKAGAIDPEFITTDGAIWRDKWNNGLVGMTEIAGANDTNPNNVNSLNRLVLKNNPNAAIVGGKPVAGPNGQGIGFAIGSKFQSIAFGIQVAKDEKKRDKIFEMLEAMATDDETYLATWLGEEGKQYDMVDGFPVLKPDFADQEKREAATGAGEYYNVFGRFNLGMQKYLQKPDDLEYQNNYYKDIKGMTSVVGFNTSGEVGYPDLWKLQDKYTVQFITGSEDIDKLFDKFVAEWKSSGGQALTDMYNNQ